MDGLEAEVERLERANAELRRVNARLGRGLVGRSGAAAAALLARAEYAEAGLERALAELAEKENAERDGRDLRAWVDDLHGQLAEHRRELEAMRATKAWRLATRYWQLRDRLLRR